MPAGRPSDYRPQYLNLIRELCENGATDAEIADVLRVSVATIYKWRNQYPELVEAIKTNKEIADQRVERSLYERATGYTRESVKIMSVNGEVKQVPFLEHVPPDPTAMIFWLKNRKPAEWRDRQEHTGADGGPIFVLERIGDKKQD